MTAARSFLACSALGFLTVVAGCSADTTSEPTGTTESMAVTDVVSMTRRSDGRFDVVCRGQNGSPNYTQVVTEAEVLANKVCNVPPPPPPPPPPPANGGNVVGQDRDFAMSHNLNNAELEQWGRGLWEGFISVEGWLDGEGGSYDTAWFVDATGATYAIGKDKIAFARLPLPVKLVAKTDGSNETTVRLRQVRLEVTRTNPILAQSLTGRFDAANNTVVRTIGADIPGVRMSLSGTARFYQNFTNGNACGRLTIRDGANQIISFTPSSASQSMSLTAPLTVNSNASCVSSRIASPESQKDFDLALSNIVLGDPR